MAIGKANAEMATLPYFVISPNSIASMVGFLRHRDEDTQGTPPADWRQATVDLVIPAHNEEKMIALALASVMRQTLQPRKIFVIDDGSSDRTAEIAQAFGEEYGLNLTVIRRKQAIGKTVGLKRQARELDSDVLVVLDADTVLESENYLERLVQELYQGVGVASVCGTVRPLHWRDRRALEQAAPLDRLWRHRGMKPDTSFSRLHVFETAITNMYRDVLYMFLQRFIYRGEMMAFGSIVNPVGCAVAYRRRYLAFLFDEVEPELGDDITNSEDIFIGFALLSRGYRNVQVPDIVAKTVEPRIRRLPRQLYLWSSAFLQSCYYYDDLLRSPLRMFAKWELKRRAAARARQIVQGVGNASAIVSNLVPAPPSPVPATSTPGDGRSSIAPFEYQAASPTSSGGVAIEDARGPAERRRITEPYRQAFGTEHTRLYGRPTGWFLATSALEKIAFPTALLLMALFRNWHGLILSVVAETVFGLVVLTMVARGERLRFLLKGLLVAPLRYAMVAVDGFTISWFAIELWVSKNRKWRK